MIYRAGGRSPRHLKQGFKGLLRELARSRGLAWQLLRRDLSARYRRSLLGFLLAFAPALAIVAWATLASRARWINIGDVHIPYPAYVLLSVTLWQLFSEALSQQVDGLAQERQLLAKLEVPPESIILSRMGETLVSFGLKLVLVALAFVWYGIPVTGLALLSLAGALSLLILGTGLGLLLAPLNAFYEDVSRSLPAITTLWFFLTPVVFPVPERGLLQLLVSLNPVTPLMVTTRQLIIGQELTALTPGLVVTLASGLILLAGWGLYRSALPLVVERTTE
jgi:lipopolysaccharide transport system permease protein